MQVCPLATWHTVPKLTAKQLARFRYRGGMRSALQINGWHVSLFICIGSEIHPVPFIPLRLKKCFVRCAIFVKVRFTFMLQHVVLVAVWIATILSTAYANRKNRRRRASACDATRWKRTQMTIAILSIGDIDLRQARKNHLHSNTRDLALSFQDVYSIWRLWVYAT